TKNEILAAFPGAEPLVLGSEKHPAMDLGIAGRKDCGLEALRTQELDELRNLLLELARPVGLFLRCLRMLLDLAFRVKDERIHVVLHFGGEFGGIEKTLAHVVMSDELHAQLRGEFELARGGVS